MRRVALVGMVLVAACRCETGPVDPVELGIRVEPRALDFGRVLEGTVAGRQLTLAAETRAPVTVQLSTAAPFAAPKVAEVPGGGDVTIEIAFLARDVVSEGVLRLTVGDKTAEVPLTGIGVRPPPCVPSAECVLSVFSLEEDRCVESPAPDDAACDPKSLCLEQGRCRSGQCLGIARRCDDNDLCTNDACSLEVGCVHTPVTCPAPTATCRVATCSPASGCGEAPAADATPCGAADCVSLHLCSSGECMTVDTPDGFPCAPPIACLPEGTCQNDACQRTFVGDWTPSWTAPLSVEPTGSLASAGSQVFLSVCGLPLDAGAPGDGGVEDAGVSDAGLDAGSDDAGSGDGGVDDGGLDAGPLVACGLASYTTTGFERFTRPYEDLAPRDVWAVGPEGVVLRAGEGLEVRTRVSGELRQRYDAPVRREQLVITDEGLVAVLGDGGLAVLRDGGATVLTAVSSTAALAGGGALFAWDADAGVLTRVELLEDGGVATETFLVQGSPSLVTEGASVLAGVGTRVLPDGDGGWRALSLWWTDAGVERVLEGETLAARDAIDVFTERCDGGTSCAPLSTETWLHVFDPATGLPRWAAPVTPAGVETRLVATTLLDEEPGAVATVVRADFDGGAQTFLQVFSDGQRRVLCRLAESSGAVLEAHFATTSLVVTARRPDGGVVLEAYPLHALPVSSAGWPRPHGLDGARLAR